MSPRVTAVKLESVQQLRHALNSVEPMKSWVILLPDRLGAVNKLDLLVQVDRGLGLETENP